MVNLLSRNIRETKRGKWSICFQETYGLFLSDYSPSSIPTEKSSRRWINVTHMTIFPFFPQLPKGKFISKSESKIETPNVWSQNFLNLKRDRHSRSTKYQQQNIKTITIMLSLNQIAFSMTLTYSLSVYLLSGNNRTILTNKKMYSQETM